MIRNTCLYAAALAAVALASGQPAHAAPINLVQNPGFETGDFTNWTVSGSPPNIGVDDYFLDVHSGNYGAFAGNDVQTGLSQVIPTVVGATYAVSFWLNVQQGDAFGGYVDATFGGQPVVTLTEPAENDTFTEYSASLVATSTSSTLAFTFRQPEGYYGFDDVSVTETSGPPPPPSVPEPGSLALLAAGLAGLAWSRRPAAHRRPPRSVAV